MATTFRNKTHKKKHTTNTIGIPQRTTTMPTYPEVFQTKNKYYCINKHGQLISDRKLTNVVKGTANVSSLPQNEITNMTQVGYCKGIAIHSGQHVINNGCCAASILSTRGEAVVLFMFEGKAVPAYVRKEGSQYYGRMLCLPYLFNSNGLTVSRKGTVRIHEEMLTSFSPDWFSHVVSVLSFDITYLPETYLEEITPYDITRETSRNISRCTFLLDYYTNRAQVTTKYALDDFINKPIMELANKLIKLHDGLRDRFTCCLRLEDENGPSLFIEITNNETEEEYRKRPKFTDETTQKYFSKELDRRKLRQEEHVMRIAQL